jgi:putative DNA primase/helicase
VYKVQVMIAGRAVNDKVSRSGGNADLGSFLEHEVIPRLTAEAIFTHPSHQFHKSSSDKWRGGCPWHESKSGTSFYVDVLSKLWRCPACDIGGGPVQYLHRLKGGLGSSPRGQDFIAIVKELAALAGLEMPAPQLGPEAAKRAQRREARRAILASIIDICRRCLLSPRGEPARAYLLKRGLNAEAAEALELGLYPEDLGRLETWLCQHGHDLEDIRSCACLFAGMAGYIVIPWHDDYGVPLTLYGRWPGDPPAGKPKTTALPNPKEQGEAWEFTKRSPLYLNRALVARHAEVVLVEGVIDAAVAQAHGDSRVVACVGAQLSSEQVRTLARRQVQAVTICLDPDQAGDNGVKSCVLHLLEAGIFPYVAPRLPEGMDPDEFILAHGIDVWREHTAKRIHGLMHLAQSIVAAQGPRPEYDAYWCDQIVDKALKLARSFPDSCDEDMSRHFLPEIASVTGGRVDMLLRQLGKHPKVALPAPAQFLATLLDLLRQMPHLARALARVLRAAENGDTHANH